MLNLSINKFSEKGLFDTYCWVIGNAFTVIMTEKDADKIISIVLNKKNGKSRQMFVMALGKIKTEKVEKTLISLLDDNDVISHAIYALGCLKSQKSNNVEHGIFSIMKKY